VDGAFLGILKIALMFGKIRKKNRTAVNPTIIFPIRQ
jgi:hypothetical protein